MQDEPKVGEQISNSEKKHVVGQFCVRLFEKHVDMLNILTASRFLQLLETSCDLASARQVVFV